MTEKKGEQEEKTQRSLIYTWALPPRSIPSTKKPKAKLSKQSSAVPQPSAVAHEWTHLISLPD